MLNVYLAGSLNTEWREEVRKEISSSFYRERIKLICPVKSLEEENSYTLYDLLAIDKCDLVLAYMENDNPSGYGLCLEVGYAKGKNKKIIFVDETSKEKYKYFGMVRASSDTVCFDLKEAIDCIIKLANLYT